MPIELDEFYRMKETNEMVFVTDCRILHVAATNPIYLFTRLLRFEQAFLHKYTGLHVWLYLQVSCLSVR